MEEIQLLKSNCQAETKRREALEIACDSVKQAHKSHIRSLASRLEQGHFDFSSKYRAEIQDLRDCPLLEQEEKNGLSKKLQALEKELLMSRTKLAQEQKTSVSSQQVEALKQKIMKLRRENEILRSFKVPVRDALILDSTPHFLLNNLLNKKSPPGLFCPLMFSLNVSTTFEGLPLILIECYGLPSHTRIDEQNKAFLKKLIWNQNEAE
ncbi:hypothetical protein CDL15_Pgr023937 [Punica granatum]|uniref:Uncharacterized protein n=1 Tax=Punica granatum TaxID=22663 RepID=A0A218XX42_PUNGR|nr:hypothetical protein CDL15_Pgr023937 [Punica granatum]